MQLDIPVRRTPRIFYGWWIVVAGFSAYFMAGALYFYGFGAFFLPLEKAFGWSRTALSGVVSLSRLEGGLLGPVEGFLVDRFGPRTMMRIGVSVMGLGFILLSFTNSLVSFYLVFILVLAMGSTLGLMTPASTAVANWFVKKRSTVMGIVFTGVGLGAMGVPLLVALIERFGWRSVCFGIGLALWAVLLPLSSVLRHRPEPYGYVPDGKPLAVPNPVGAQEHNTRNPGDALPQDWTLRQALKTPAFWLLAMSFGLRTMATQAIALHLIPYLVGQGFSSKQAGSVLAAVGLFSITGRLGFGWLGDHINKRHAVAISNLLVGASMFILVNTHSWWMVMLFVVVYAPGYGGSLPIMTAMRGDYFGRRYFATISGAMGFISTLGTVGGPLLAGVAYDTTGSYRGAFLFYVAATVLAAVLILLARKPLLKSAPTSHP